ncbi:hypothetical protein H9Y04_23845 [Streptomyces sp. TRM66268-LWL]|uniref:DUF4259 domain-containing protein n=1 Tax=Streptomyces polyasparticus TaxID=2767826 RepID=A0ABR7SLX0_9ACTN|nr:hypothetical protein [Streptomyces polyasparticus]MBC9715587.1 hypothetical protein [Streptomyces polyasparticus]
MNRSADRVAELGGDWESIREGYYPGDRSAKDACVLDCAEALVAARSGGDALGAAFHALGLVQMYGYVAWEPGPGVEERVVAVLGEVVAEGRAVDCAHDGHPGEGDVESLIERFPEILPLILDASDDAWEGVEDLDGLDEEGADGAAAASAWRCPRNIAAFAREAILNIRPDAAV